jgi:Putative MetA-pathway of phenol degradation
LHRHLRAALTGLALLVPLAAHAADAPDLSVNRPGLDTPPSTLPAGRVVVEVGAVGWEYSASPSTRDDSLTYADTVIRVGLGHSTELEVGLGGWAHQRQRAGTSVSTASGLGDATFAVRHGFGSEADAKVALQAFVTAPVGRAPGGAGDWGAGLLLPVALPLPAGFTLATTPEIDAAVNASGHGRHLAWGAVAGFSHALTRTISASAEVSAFRDEDPDGASTESRFALAAAWRAGRRLQIDVEFDTGLTRATPDHALIVGFARQF